MNVKISDAAAQQIVQILLREPDKIALRISVEGGGCSGFSYKYDLVSEMGKDDLVFKKDGAIVLIDSLSIPFMEGAEIDFVDDLMGQSFQIHNPNAVSSCGCGVSFSI
ncbi:MULTISPECIES: iron-sulfur cluster assembly accessory protein [unclassified Bartonella]|uniref:HesB/IscA family protein n=1 Tax=unclassified Bartonella TaxID=2645622 RepID=UPI002360D75A|nr:MULTISPECIES: iron-sulfur cluster assembly accessory protein [unclassified Bartonella]